MPFHFNHLNGNLWPNIFVGPSIFLGPNIFVGPNECPIEYETKQNKTRSQLAMQKTGLTNYSSILVFSGLEKGMDGCDHYG